MKQKRTKKQIAAAKRNLAKWEHRQYSEAVLTGFVIGSVVVFVAAMVGLAIGR